MVRGKIPPADAAVENIRNYINVNGLSEGEKLPSERDMCEMWGISRSALRSAIRHLTTMHVLESRQGSGTYVAPARPISYSGVGKVMGFSDNVRSSGHTPSSLVVSQGACAADAHVAKKMGVDVGHAVFKLVRLRRVDGLPCMLETSMVNTDVCPGIASHDFSGESLFDVIRDGYCLDIAHGWDSLSISRLDEWEADLLGGKPGASVLFQQGVSRDGDGRCIEYYKSVIRPDRYTFVSLCGWPVDSQKALW